MIFSFATFFCYLKQIGQNEIGVQSYEKATEQKWKHKSLFEWLGHDRRVWTTGISKILLVMLKVKRPTGEPRRVLLITYPKI